MYREISFKEAVHLYFVAQAFKKVSRCILVINSHTEGVLRYLLTHAIRPVESSISSNYFLLKSLVTFPCIVKYLQKQIQF